MTKNDLCFKRTILKTHQSSGSIGTDCGGNTITLEQKVKCQGFFLFSAFAEGIVVVNVKRWYNSRLVAVMKEHQIKSPSIIRSVVRSTCEHGFRWK